MPTPRGLSTAQKLVIEYYRAKLNLMHVVNARWAAAAAIDLFQKPYASYRKKDPPLFKKARRTRLTSGKEKLAVYQWESHQPNGQHLLVAHGFAGNCRSFEKYIGTALAKGYHVTTFDAPAHGKSTGQRLNLLSYSWALDDVWKHHGHFDACLAHSLGCMSLLLALERQEASVPRPRLVLIAPLVEAWRAADNFGSFLQLPAALLQQMNNEITRMAGHPLTHFSLPRLVAPYPQPVLWLHDRLDDTTPFADVEPVQHSLPPHVQLIVTEGLGHSRIYRDNKVRKTISEWL